MLATLKVPTLVISGAADLATPPSIARIIAAKIPNAELVVAPESGHSIYWGSPRCSIARCWRLWPSIRGRAARGASHGAGTHGQAWDGGGRNLRVVGSC